MAVRETSSHRYGKSHAIWDHSVTYNPTEVTFPPLPQPKLVLDLATLEGCKALASVTFCRLMHKLYKNEY